MLRLVTLLPFVLAACHGAGRATPTADTDAGVDTDTLVAGDTDGGSLDDTGRGDTMTWRTDTQGSPGCAGGTIIVHHDVTIAPYDAGSGGPWDTGALDAHLANLRCVREITGSLDIQYTGASSLKALSHLTRVGERLLITDNPALTSLHGLESLTSVGSGGETMGVYVKNNPLLATLAGLDGLESIQGNLVVEDSPGLASLTGLEKLQSVSRELSIRSNPALTSLDGLGGLTTASYLYVDENPALVTLHGLENLTSVDQLMIHDDPALTTLAPIQVTSMTELYIESNLSLTSLAGLERLQTVRFLILLRSNPSLTSLAGLSGVTTVGPSGVADIQQNAALCQSEVDAWLDRIGQLSTCTPPSPCADNDTGC